MQLRRVVVTGLARSRLLVTPSRDYWEGLVSGRSGAAPITRFDAASSNTVRLRGEGSTRRTTLIAGRPGRWIPFAQFALVCSDEALKDSGLLPKASTAMAWTVMRGSGIGGLKTFRMNA